MRLTENPQDNTENIQWGYRALAFARAFADALPGRGSATRAEAAAAESVRQQLASIGVGNVRTQPFQGQRSIWLFLAQAFGLALVGHAAFWLLPRPLGEIPALLIATAAFVLASYRLWRKFTFHGLPPKLVGARSKPAPTSLPSGPSQNIIAVIPPSGAIQVRQQRRVVLLAHLDSHRAVWVFAHPLIARVYSLIAPLALYGMLAAPICYALMLLTGVAAFGWLALLLGLIHFISWFTGVTADLGPYSPGANDNASAVGSLLALGQRLQEAPLAHTEIWLVFTGCEESGGDGMLQLLAEHGAELQDALFIDLELVGIGDRLVYLETEGMLRHRNITPAVQSLVQQAAQRLAGRTAPDGATAAALESAGHHPQVKPLHGSLRGAYTEMNIAWEHGFQGVCLMVLSSTERGLPQWHRMTDTSKNYQENAFSLAHNFVWELLRVWDESA